MKAALVQVVAAAGLASAQLLDDIPSCANSCVSDYTTGGQVAGCGQLDMGCICRNSDFIQGVACCVVGVCTQEEGDRAVSIASRLCSSIGADVPESIVCDTPNATTTISSSPSNTGSADEDEDDAAPRIVGGSMGGALAGAVAAALFAL